MHIHDKSFNHCRSMFNDFYHEAYDVVRRYMYVFQFSPLPRYFKNTQYVNNIEC